MKTVTHCRILHLLTAIHLAATWGMVGVIWFVQVVHYPLFAAVGSSGFAAYEVRHRELTTIVVLPLMLVELITALGLMFLNRGSERRKALFALIILTTIWLSTFLVQVPLHDALAAEFQIGKHALLVQSNWWRTLAWTFRGVMAILMSMGVLQMSMVTVLRKESLEQH